MADSQDKTVGLPQQSDRGHPMPRRASPETSITLANHRLGREPSRKPSNVDTTVPAVNAARRDSSGESHDTRHSDPKNWFDRSNRNPTATYDAGCMDVDPPFFQKETGFSNDARIEGNSLAYMQDSRPDMFRRATHSSSADDYRSVIDDLTIENKRLKEELKRYKNFGPPMLRKEQVFELKVHGLTGWKRRELEETLRDFAAGLGGDGDSRDSPGQHRKSARQGKDSGESLSKHDSSSSSRSRPVDSAYASMSTGLSSNAPNSIPSLGRPSIGSRAKSVQQKVESYLRDTPDGLFPQHVMLSEKQKKKMVVRRLEQLFTGKIRGKSIQRNQSMPSLDVQASSSQAPMAPPRIPEASREAYIQQYSSQKKNNSRDNFSNSNSNSNGDQTELGRDSGGSGGRGGSNTSPPDPPLPEQRPTRPLDLDPDRVQVPLDNLNYIRHLGLVPNEFLLGKKAQYEDVSPDADGWVYLNLLCNLAQLHMISVTPAFIRAAVSEKSTKFQLSPDGRKIRWRGGTVGTKFSSDSSGDNSQRSPSTDETDGSNENGQRKRMKTTGSAPATNTAVSSKESKFGPHLSNSSHSFHYRPLFARRSSSLESSVIGDASQPSDGGGEDIDWDGSGSSKRKRRRNDGAIIFYSGAPFCTDLSGDVGHWSPSTSLETSTGQESEPVKSPRPTLVHRTLSGSSLPIRPLSDPPALVSEVLEFDVQNPPAPLDEDDSPVDEPSPFIWGEDLEKVQPQPLALLEPSFMSLNGPEDHFAIIVTTRRTIRRNTVDRSALFDDVADAVVSRLQSLRTSSPLPPLRPKRFGPPIQIEILSEEFRPLDPVPLPPPITLHQPDSSDTGSDECGQEGDSFEEDLIGPDSPSGELSSQRVNPHQSDVDLDHEGAILAGEEDVQIGLGDEDERMDQEWLQHPGLSISGDLGVEIDDQEMGPAASLQSSVATAGGAESGYSSSTDDDSHDIGLERGIP
ncbi:putative frequency clock protein [Naviculisporaceae sp. PSN 640]